MKVKDAKHITGSMTRTKKMPGLSYSLPAWECITGKKLRKITKIQCAPDAMHSKEIIQDILLLKHAQYYRLRLPDGARLGSGHGCASEAPEVVQVA